MYGELDSKGQIRWVAKGDVGSQSQFIESCSALLPITFYSHKALSALGLVLVKVRNGIRRDNWQELTVSFSKASVDI
jgi:hypothetical protein